MDSRILIIDEDVKLLAKLDDYITKTGYPVKTVNSPFRGLELAKKEYFPVIFFNHDFKVMTGTEFLKSILNHNSKTQVIIMTENNDLNKILKCIESGAFDYIKKPINDLSIIKKAIDDSIEKLNKWNQIKRAREIS